MNGIFLGVSVLAMSGVFNIRDNIDLHLGQGSVLKGSPDRVDYSPVDVCVQNYASSAECASGSPVLSHRVPIGCVCGRE